MSTSNNTEADAAPKRFDREAFFAAKQAEAREVLVTALGDEGRESFSTAMSVWLGALRTADLSFLCEAFDHEQLATIFRRAANVRSLVAFHFALGLSEAMAKADVQRMEAEERPECEWRYLTKFIPGSIYKAVVSRIAKFGAFLTVEGVPAFIHVSQIDWYHVEAPEDRLEVGQEFQVVMMCVDWESRRLEVSRRHLGLAQWRNGVARHPMGSQVEGIVISQTAQTTWLKVEEGFAVSLTWNEVGWRQKPGPGEKVDAMIRRINMQDEEVTASFRRFTQNGWENHSSKYPVGSQFTGIVISMEVSNAIVVSADDVYGILRYDEVSWDPRAGSKALKPGKTITAKVISIDRENKWLHLTLKQRGDDPWLTAPDKYPVGTKVKGIVTSVLDYGAIVELEPDLLGMVTKNEIVWSDRKVKTVDHLKVGDQVEAVVVRITPDERNIHLSIRQARPNPWDTVATDFPIGARVRGKVVNIVDYGAFMDLGQGMQGLLHNEQVSWLEKTSAKKMLTLGQDLEVVVVGTDGVKKQITLGLKQLTVDPWTLVDQHIKVGDIIKGKICKVIKIGIFIDLGEVSPQLAQLHAFWPRRFVPTPPDAKVEDVYVAGQTIPVKVFSIDIEKKRIGVTSC